MRTCYNCGCEMDGNNSGGWLGENYVCFYCYKDYYSKFTMTKEEARTILEKSPTVTGEEENGITYYHEVGSYIGEYIDSFIFVGYPYTSKTKSPKYDFAFKLFVLKDDGEVTSSSSPLSPYELRKIENQNKLSRLIPKENTVKTKEQARAILEASTFVKGDISQGDNDKGTVYFFKIGDFYYETNELYAFFGYHYTSIDPEIRKENSRELFVEKWRGEIGFSLETLSELGIDETSPGSISQDRENSIHWLGSEGDFAWTFN